MNTRFERMSYENTKCPCGDRKEGGTMICETCDELLKPTVEHAAWMNEKLSMHTRRSAAIKVLAMSRRRKVTRWPVVDGTEVVKCGV